jgi:hypothetical protein
MPGEHSPDAAANSHFVGMQARRLTHEAINLSSRFRVFFVDQYFMTSF